MPPDDPVVARCIARAPGGPIHVLTDNERAEHVPGCNMAFKRDKLREIGGFDPVYRAAGDDVDVCWKLLDMGYEIHFHPSAVVWHRRRNSVKAFWRQQAGYGRAEALVERNHPEKFNDLGQAVWRGVVYGPTGSVLPRRARIYSGRFGEAPFQGLYGGGGLFNPLPVLALILSSLLLALFSPFLLILPTLGLAALGAAYARHGVGVARRDGLRPAWRNGALIGLLHLLPPLARSWGRLRVRDLPESGGERPPYWPFERVGRGLFVNGGLENVGREAFLEGLRDRLTGAGLRPKPSSEWDEWDAVSDSALFWRARMVSYETWEALYLRLRMRPRPARLLAAVFVPVPIAFFSPVLALAAVAGIVALVVVDGVRFGRGVRRVLTGAPKGGKKRG